MSLTNLTTFIDSAIVNSGKMQALFPEQTVRLYWEWAPSQTKESLQYAVPHDIFPYIVWNIEVDDDQATWAFQNGYMNFSVWNYGGGEAARKVLQIRDVLVGLLQRRFYEEPEGIRALRLWKVRDRSMKDTTENDKVWRRDVTFNMRYYDQSAVEAVLERVAETGGH